MTDKKLVVQGGFGPVPMAENGRRYIDVEPVEIDLAGANGSYYVRRMMSGELVEYAASPALAKRVESVVGKEWSVDVEATKRVQTEK